jgi:hypothetical protein
VLKIRSGLQIRLADQIVLGSWREKKEERKIEERKKGVFLVGSFTIRRF